MTITVDHKELRAALARVKPATVGLRGFTSMVRLAGMSGNELCVSSDDGDMRISTICPVSRTTSEGDFDVCLPFATMVKICDSWSAPLVMEELSDGRVSIERRQSETRFTTIQDVRTPTVEKAEGPPVSLPSRRRPVDPSTWMCPGPVLDSMRLAAVVAGTDDARPVLAQVHLDPAGHVVATDSYRLAYHPHEPTDLPNEHLGIPVPMVKAIPADTGEILVTYNIKERCVELACDSATTITGRTVDGEFPNWRGLAPKSKQCVTVVDTTLHQIQRAVRMCKPFSDYTPMTWGWDPKAEVFRWGLYIPDTLDLSGELPGEDRREGRPSIEVRIGLNPTYLAEAAAITGSGVVRIGIIDNLKPLLLSDPDGRHNCLLMPVRES